MMRNNFQKLLKKKEYIIVIFRLFTKAIFEENTKDIPHIKGESFEFSAISISATSFGD